MLEIVESSFFKPLLEAVPDPPDLKLVLKLVGGQSPLLPRYINIYDIWSLSAIIDCESLSLFRF